MHVPSLKLQNVLKIFTLTLRSLHWLKINERIEYKLLSLTYTRLASLTTYTISLSVQSIHAEPAPHLLLA